MTSPSSIDDFSDPGSWARELAARPAEINPALVDHVREFGQITKERLDLLSRTERMQEEIRYLRYYCDRDEVAVADKARSERWLDKP
jgi:hypothetical protein